MVHSQPSAIKHEVCAVFAANTGWNEWSEYLMTIQIKTNFTAIIPLQIFMAHITS